MLADDGDMQRRIAMAIQENQIRAELEHGSYGVQVTALDRMVQGRHPKTADCVDLGP